MQKSVLWIVAIAGVAGLIYGLSQYYKPHPNLESQAADFLVDSQALFTAFQTNESAANEMYLNNLVQVTGIVREISPLADGGYTLILDAGDPMFGVNCAFLPESSAGLEGIVAESEVVVKGICTGMLMDVNLSRCVLVP